VENGNLVYVNASAALRIPPRIDARCCAPWPDPSTIDSSSSWTVGRRVRTKLHLSDTTRTLISLYVPAMVMSLGQGMVVPTIPALAAAFDVSAGLAAQLVTASMLGRVLSLVPTGQILDRYGRRPVLLAAPAVIAAASALTAVAPFFPVLLFAQFVAGIGLNSWLVAREVAVVDLVRPDQRGRMIAGFHGMSSVGIAVGPVLGGIVTDHVGFRAVFWVYALISLFTLITSLGIRETGTRPTEKRSWFDIGRLSEIEPYFRVTYVVVVINTFVAFMRGSLIQSLIPLYIGIQLGLSSTEVGTWFGIYGLLNVLMIAPTGILSDARGRKAVVMPSAYLAVVVFAAFPLVMGSPQLWVLAVLAGISSGLALGTMATYTYDIVPAQSRARMQALRRLLGDMGSVVGPMMGGAIADAASPSVAFWVFVPLQLVAGLLITFLARESLHRVTHAPEPAPPK
jgi:MFS transporter, DHA1 family, multidrug resistance protein